MQSGRCKPARARALGRRRAGYKPRGTDPDLRTQGGGLSAALAHGLQGSDPAKADADSKQCLEQPVVPGPCAETLKEWPGPPQKLYKGLLHPQAQGNTGFLSPLVTSRSHSPSTESGSGVDCGRNQERQWYSSCKKTSGSWRGEASVSSQPAQLCGAIACDKEIDFPEDRSHAVPSLEVLFWLESRLGLGAGA